jgi:Tfp pilus assembly protein FimV
LVAVPARSWRQFTWPTAFLLAVTVAVFGIRAALHHSPATPRPRTPHVTHVAVAVKARYYRVRPGDTLTAIAANSRTSVARLLHLNPKLQPTALFIGERIRLP